MGEVDKCFWRRAIFKGMSVSKNLFFGLFLLSLFSVFLASNVSGQSAVVKAKVIPVNGGPLISIEPIPLEIKNTPFTTCLTPQFIETYLQTQAKYDAYVAKQNKQAQCASGYARATVLLSQYTDAANSVVSVDTRIASLKKVSAYLESLKDVNGLSLRAIPAGNIADNPYPTVVGISMQCLKDSAGNIIVPSVAVGDEQSAGAQVFREVSDGQSALLEQVRKDNSELKAKADQAKAGKKKAGKKKKADAGESVDLGFFVLDVVGKVAKDFIPILPEDLEQSYVAFSKNNSYLSLGLSFFLKDGKVQRNNEIAWLKAYMIGLELIPFKGPVMKSHIQKTEKLLSHPTLKDPFVEVDLKLDQITYDDVEVPETTVFSDIKAATANHLKRYEALKTQFEKARDAFKAEWDTLKGNNYNCS